MQTLDKLEQVLSKLNVHSFNTTVYVLDKGILKEIHLKHKVEKPGSPFHTSLSGAFSQLSDRFREAVIYPESVMVEGYSGDSPVYCAVQDAWRECIPNAEKEDFAFNTPSNFRTALLTARLLPLLSAGPAGIQKWNEQKQIDNLIVTSVSWDHSQLAGKVLKKINLYNLQFGGSNFDGADLEQANLWAKLHGASFCRANLNKASLNFAEASGAKFNGASMKQCKMEGANLRNCEFVDADLTKADLRNCQLQGAHLSKANLTDARLENAQYDELTIWPQPIPQWESLCWKGHGSDPYKTHVREIFKRDGCQSFDQFKTQVSVHFDRAKVSNAFKMLKKERFQLFWQVENTYLVGIVKSQTNPDLVYACSLTADGEFFCGTQNLKPCGGLSGSLCKHLLVLTIGLARAGQVDLTVTTKWMLESMAKRQTTMNKQLMTDVFLRYKGAEAGEVDWRPTETIPEDYFAY